MSAILITGANRGLGFEHARQYAEQGWQVHACARNPATAETLQQLAAAHPDSVVLYSLDVTDHAAVDALAARLADTSIDILLNNAGTFGPQGAPEGMAYQSLDNMDYGLWRTMLEVNLLAPFKVATAFQSQLLASEARLLVMMSSDLGSIANNHGHSYSYRSSKAGLNMLTKGMASEWPELVVISMAPGWCKTQLGGSDAPIDPVDSVRDQQLLFARLQAEHSGRFLDRFGDDVAW
jgi:NAD(P)-dependent dehydrogenase (short-subunit alcohol dehydrogenase family)